MNQDIFRLEVPMDDRKCMRIVKPINNLFEVDQGLHRGETTTINQEVKQLTAFDVFQDEIKFLLAFVNVVYAHDVRMVHELHHRDFPVDSKALLVVLGLRRGQGRPRVEQRRYRENFDGRELARNIVLGEFNPPRRAFSNALA